MSIDQSLSCSGYIIWDKSVPKTWGVIKTATDPDVVKRLRSITSTMSDLITLHNITEIVVESLPYGARSTSVRPLAALYYFINNLCVERNIKFDEANVSGVKKFATGKGNADKNLMIEHFAMKDPDLWNAVVNSGLRKTTGLADVADAYHIGRFHLSNSTHRITYNGYTYKYKY